MNNRQLWLSALNENKANFKKHIIHDKLSEYEKNTYSVMHAGFILFNGNISSEQERLYDFWLGAISFDLKVSDVIKQAQELTSEELYSGIVLLKEKKLSQYFLMDVLIFCYLTDFTDDFKEVISEWCQVFSISAKELDSIVSLIKCMLSDENNITYNDTIDELIKNPIWHEFYSKPFDFDKDIDVNGGIWFVNESYSKIYNNFHVSNALIVFQHGSSISFVDNNVNLTNCTLLNPILDLNNASLLLNNSFLKGNYPKSESFSVVYIEPTQKEIKINNCRFNTNNAQSISTNAFKTDVMNCLFEDCGNSLINGGAIWHNGNVFFYNCRFVSCVAKIGGAIYSYKVIEQDNIIGCSFFNCSSSENLGSAANANKSHSAGAIYYSGCKKNENCIIDSYIDTNITIYKLNNSHEHTKSLLSNTIIAGNVLYCELEKNKSFFGSVLTEESKVINKVLARESKNIKVYIE